MSLVTFVSPVTFRDTCQKSSKIAEFSPKMVQRREAPAWPSRSGKYLKAIPEILVPDDTSDAIVLLVTGEILNSVR